MESTLVALLVEGNTQWKHFDYCLLLYFLSIDQVLPCLDTSLKLINWMKFHLLLIMILKTLGWGNYLFFSWETMDCRKSVTDCKGERDACLSAALLTQQCDSEKQMCSCSLSKRCSFCQLGFCYYYNLSLVYLLFIVYLWLSLSRSWEVDFESKTT